ncbi:MAG: methyltransferase domain-containing protein [Nitrospiraceae bacterium]
MFGKLKERLEYHQYRRAQIRQSRAKRNKDASFRIVPFVALIKRRCTDLRSESPILCIGARNVVELDVLERNGFRNIVGIDLWSGSPRIIVCDMHRLIFRDDSFDLIFASHVFEHAWNFRQVAAECVRVLRPGGYIFCAVPTGFTPTHHDRYDFKDASGILAYFTHWRVSLLEEQRLHPGELLLLFQVES